jgi:outer membrane receptor for ferrienterochelin and colicin
VRPLPQTAKYWLVFGGWLVNIPFTMRALREVIRAVALMFVAAAAVPAEEPSNPASTNSYDLTQLRLEDLMRVKVFSVSKHLQPWFQAPAAIYVITGEDIRRSGATSLPEALRLAPGMDVARMNVHAWAVSARGFNSLFSDKLLVMLDGRSVYTPVFSGVWWNAQDILLDNVDRIEVMRGVDGTLWGANAVNVRVAWRPNAQWEVAVVGQHLGRTHAELGRSFVTGAERVPASVYGQVTWRY